MAVNENRLGVTKGIRL